jgi:hypothetical protein
MKLLLSFSLNMNLILIKVISWERFAADNNNMKRQRSFIPSPSFLLKLKKKSGKLDVPRSTGAKE